MFQSPPSTRTATTAEQVRQKFKDVSIPAVHADGDPSIAERLASVFRFNPRRPRGRRPQPCASGNSGARFQSPPSTRTATFTGDLNTGAMQFQSPPSTRTATAKLYKREALITMLFIRSKKTLRTFKTVGTILLVLVEVICIIPVRTFWDLYGCFGFAQHLKDKGFFY